jgi:hypothetical protein
VTQHLLAAEHLEEVELQVSQVALVVAHDWVPPRRDVVTDLYWPVTSIVLLTSNECNLLWVMPRRDDPHEPGFAG